MTKKRSHQEPFSTALLAHALFAVPNPPPLPPQLQAIVDEAGRFLSQTQRNLYSLGRIYQRLQTISPPAVLDDYGGTAASFWATFIPQDDVTLRSVQRWARVSRWPWAVAKKFGVTSLDLLLHYASIKGIELGDDPGPTVVSFTDESGKAVSKPFSECQVSDMQRAVQTGDDRDKPDELDPDDVKEVKDLKKRLLAATEKDDAWIKFRMRNDYGEPLREWPFMGHRASGEATSEWARATRAKSDRLRRPMSRFRSTWRPTPRASSGW